MTALARRSSLLVVLACVSSLATHVDPAHAAQGPAARSFDLSKAAATRTPLDAGADAAAAGAEAFASRSGAPNPVVSGLGLPYGPSLSTAGDINGTGYSDQLVGLPIPGFGGTVKVLYRGPGGITIQTLDEPQGDQACFGNSVASADVNGDGFPDVIVGDPFQTNGATAEGAIFVYHGTAFGLPALPTATRYHGGAFANFGYSVSYAGDVNGDGYDDVIVGAPGWQDDLNQEGAAYVYLGGPNGIAQNPVWEIEGDTNFGWLGFDVSTAGDVNGDGYDDVVIGEPNYVNGESIEGRVHVYFGSPAGPQNFPALLHESNVNGANLGWSVSTAGDANADGFADYAAGAPFYTNGQSAEGAVYLFQGSQDIFFGPPPIIAEGATAQHNYGWDLACGGDFNGDGLADLIAGRPGYSNVSGMVGSYDVMLGLWDLSVWPFPGAFFGTTVNGGFGRRVGIGGDVDGDGFSDPLTLEFGSAFAANGAPSDTPALNGTQEPTLVEVHGFSLAILGFGVRDRASAGPFNSHNGWALATGDVNGDGFDDLVSGGPLAPAGALHGVLQLYFGHPSRLGNAPPFPFAYPPSDWTYQSSTVGELGTSVAVADVNADGYDDIVAGAPHFSNGQSNEGAVYVFLGSPGGPSTSPDAILEGNLLNGEFGTSVAAAGDVNSDGFADVLVGAPLQALGTTDEGAAYLYYGSALGLSHAPARVYEGNANFALMGLWVSGLGDLDNDGHDDFGIGVPGYANGQANEGAIFVYRGTPAGPGAVWDVVESNQAGAFFGRSFSAAGDVNRDGRGDLLVGLPGYSVGFPNEGQIRIYYGNVAGFPDFASWTREGGGADLRLGWSVSGAGDINGDGFSDFVAGLPGSFAGDGSAWVLLGNAPDPSIFPVQELYEGESGNTGHVVVGGADFNGDGCGDVAAGSPFTEVGKGFQDGTVMYAFPGVLQDSQLVHRPIDAFRPFADTRIGTSLRSDAPSAYRLRALARSIAGRGRVRTEVESKAVGAAFNGLGLVRSPWIKTTSPQSGSPNTVNTTVNLTGLAANTKYHWRARYAMRSPLFNPSHWISPQANAVTQGDVRTAGGEFTVGIEPPVVGSTTLALAGARPNPATSALSVTSFAFALPREGRVSLVLHDASGRRVRELLDRDHAAGAGTAMWDLRDDAGARVSAGVYFARLVFEGESRESKVVVLP